MIIKKINVIFFLIILSTVFQVQASNMGFLKYAVISDFNEADINTLNESYHQVLNDNKVGDVLRWENESTKNGGEITVIKEYKKNKNVCKRLKFRNQSKHQSAMSYYNFCLIDKKWLIVN